MNKKLSSLSRFLKTKGFERESILAEKLNKKAFGLSLLSFMATGCKTDSFSNEGNAFYWGVEKEGNGWRMYNSALPNGYDKVKACYTKKDSGLFDSSKLISIIKEMNISEDKKDLMINSISDYSSDLWKREIEPIIIENDLYVMAYIKLTWKSDILFENMDYDGEIYIQKNINKPLGYPEDLSHDQVISELNNQKDKDAAELARSSNSINIGKKNFELWDGTPFEVNCYVRVWPLDELYLIPDGTDFCSKTDLSSDCIEDFSLEKLYNLMGVSKEEADPSSLFT